MRDSKKKRLEKKGWKVGGATDFLELSPDDPAYIDMKFRLAESLRDCMGPWVR